MRNDAKVTVVCSQKGGVGKTTVTVNLAAITAEVHEPQINPEVEQRLQAKFKSGQELTEDDWGQYQSQVFAVSTDPQPSLPEWMAKVEAELNKAGKPLPIDYAQQHKNPQVLARLKTLTQYRNIFVDSPGWLEDDDDEAPSPLSKAEEAAGKKILTATLEHADLAIVVMEPEELAFRPTRRIIDQVMKPLGINYIVVINNWDPRDGTGDLEDTRARIKKLKWPLATTVIRRYKLHTAAPAAGKLCTHYAKNRTATEAKNDFFKLGMELALNGGGR
jgi:chromosome partitioning protein